MLEFGVVGAVGLILGGCGFLYSFCFGFLVYDDDFWEGEVFRYFGVGLRGGRFGFGFSVLVEAWVGFVFGIWFSVFFILMIDFFGLVLDCVVRG